MVELTQEIIGALYFFLPGYVANTLPGIFGGDLPVDLYTNFRDGRRLLGDGVTVRGFLVGVSGGLAVGAMMGELKVGFFMSLGALLGDALGSFLKRRLRFKRGAPAPLLDQLNFVAGGLILASLVTTISWEYVLVLLVITPFGHLAVNWLGYSLKLKKVPW